jgi:mitotic spindle assembly checkpoint protein MAD1
VSNKASRKYEALAQELRDAQAQHINEKANLEKKVRDLQEQNLSLREDTEDAQAQLTDQGRQHLHQINDIEAKRVALQDTADHLRYDMQRVSQDLEDVQTRLSKRNVEVEKLEADIVQLKSHIGDGESLAVVQRELSDQVTHIRKLESTNREQIAELRRLRNAHQSVQVVEEQKRSLGTELQVLQDVHRQLGEAQIQKEMLEDEKRTWSTLLEREGREAEFDSPEAVVKAFVQERIERASLVDRVGKLEAALSEKDENVRALEAEKLSLKEVVKEQKANHQNGANDLPDNKAYRRLERQQVLAVKEVEYLRAQLKTFDSEETVLMSNENFDTQRAEQVKRLEGIVDEYRQEIQSLHTEISKHEFAPAIQPRGTKRSISESVDSQESQLGPLLRKNKNLQSALSEATMKITLLSTELQASKSQLNSLTSRSRTRVLELRSNPTANHEAIKISTLSTLRAENAALLSQLRGQDLSNIPVVPAATVDNLTMQLSRLQADVSGAQKQTRRLREIFGSKATEFREAVASILGFKIDFLPNGKARITSTYHVRRRRQTADGDGETSNNEAEEDDDEEHANNNSIIFDGEEGTMKFSGGANSPFAVEMRELVTFWVQERRSVPCFLAAMTLELWEKSSKDEGEGEAEGEGEGGNGNGSGRNRVGPGNGDGEGEGAG